jgi:lysophospholipase L1-like esterase
MIEAFGDSHAGKFGGHPSFKYCWDLGQATAHNICVERTSNGGLQKLQECLYFYDPENVLLFVLGEIDCRIHFFRQSIIQGRPYVDLMTETVGRYGTIIKAVREHDRPLVCVLDVPPAQPVGNTFDIDHYGSQDERAEISALFNIVLGAWCERVEIPFIKLYPYIADERGWLKEEYVLEDLTHISPLAADFVVEEIAKCFPDSV